MSDKECRYKNQDGTYTCECGRSFSNSQSLLGHFGWCIPHREKLGKDCNQEVFKSRTSAGNPHNFKNISDDKRIEYKRRSREKLIENLNSGKIKPSFLGKQHTVETKEKIRKSRIEVLSDGIVHPGFDKSRLTYIERWFINEIILKNNLHCKYDIINEMRIYPYFLDFAFSDIKLDVELDGDYHNTDDRKKRDDKRADYLSKLGWETYRITARDIKISPDKIKSDFMSYINRVNPNKKLGCMVYRLNCEHILEPERYFS